MAATTYKKKVLVSILNQGHVRSELCSAIKVIENDPRYEVTLIYSCLKPSENNRNYTAQLGRNYDFFLTIDDDVVPLKNPLDLIEMNLDIVACATPQWNLTDPNYPLYFVGMDRVEGGYKEHKKKQGLQEVDAVGSGCLLIAKRVLEAIEEPFVRKWKDGFAITGLDFYFCEKAKEKGFKVYCHYGYLCDHYKELSLLSVLHFKHGG